VSTDLVRLRRVSHRAHGGHREEEKLTEKWTKSFKRSASRRISNPKISSLLLALSMASATAVATFSFFPAGPCGSGVLAGASGWWGKRKRVSDRDSVSE
jgi:hypothetical protein